MRNENENENSVTQKTNIDDWTLCKSTAQMLKKKPKMTASTLRLIVRRR